MENKLKPLRGGGNVVSKKDLQQREQKFSNVFTQFRKRKRMFKCVYSDNM